MAVSLLVEGPKLDKSSKRPKSTPIAHNLVPTAPEESLTIFLSILFKLNFYLSSISTLII